ncbi:permease [Parafrankia colletiae]|uniref:permease n=1 Tax=Parafrankia colletiae TaxID=573497 RepID=UPI001F52050A|nr:permease [Parafrankia colletiae]
MSAAHDPSSDDPPAPTVTVRALPGQFTEAFGVALLPAVLVGTVLALALDLSGDAGAGIAAAGWLLLTPLLWWGTSIRFEPAQLVVTRPWHRRRIAWSEVFHATWANTSDPESGDRERWAGVVVQRPRRGGPPVTLDDAPARFGDYRRWRRANLRTRRLPITFPERRPPTPNAPPQLDDVPRGRLERHAQRVRAVVREQLAAHGHPLP